MGIVLLSRRDTDVRVFLAVTFLYSGVTFPYDTLTRDAGHDEYGRLCTRRWSCRRLAAVWYDLPGWYDVDSLYVHDEEG